MISYRNFTMKLRKKGLLPNKCIIVREGDEMKRKLFCIWNLFCILCVFPGCSTQERSNMDIQYNNFVSARNSRQIEVDKIDKSLFMAYSARGSLSILVGFENLKNEGVFDIVRYSKGRYYTVSRLSDGSFFFMLFQENGSDQKHLILTDGFRTKELLDKEDFDVIKVGMTKEEVLKLDPYSEDSGHSFDDSSTVHRFTDRSVIQVEYQLDENNNPIVSMIWEDHTENSVLSYLIPKDLALISAKE